MSAATIVSSDERRPMRNRGFTTTLIASLDLVQSGLPVTAIRGTET